MPDSLQLVGGLVWAGLIAAWLAYNRSASRVRVAAGRGECATCGAAIDEAPGNSVTGRGVMCAACFSRTRRNYRAASWLFLGLSAMFFAAGPFIVAADYQRFGTQAALDDAVMLVGVILIAGLPGGLLRRLGREA
jgi:hypothetical protein